MYVKLGWKWPRNFRHGKYSKLLWNNASLAFGAHIPIEIEGSMYTEPKTVGKTTPTKCRESQHAWAEIFFWGAHAGRIEQVFFGFQILNIYVNIYGIFLVVSISY